jgi:myo-inositol-1(or 4)-monophosphatase
MTRFGGDCYNYCLLAMGTIDLIVESGLAPYDIAPLIPLIEAAGGIITTWEGDSAASGGKIIAAGSKELHQKAREVLSS